MDKTFRSSTIINRNICIVALLAILIGVSAGCFEQSSQDRGSQRSNTLKKDNDITSQIPSDKTTALSVLNKPVSKSPLREVEPIPSAKAPSEYLFLNSQYIQDAVVVVTLPLDYEARPDKTYPLVIAFGGAGECARPPRQGALAWLGYYKMDDAVTALTRNHLESNDFRGLVTQDRLLEFNDRLKERPYSGVIVACPYSPLITSFRDFEDPGYEQYIIQELVPLLKKRYRVAEGFIGVDGVSMGGARAMLYGLKHPDVFSAIGAVQGAFGPSLETYRQLIDKNRGKLKNRSIQLVTSDGDGMAPSVEKMSLLLKDEGIPHTYMNLTGPHDYIFNQGPGSIALLMFHDRAQRTKQHGPIK